jgi:hypothetical protein
MCSPISFLKHLIYFELHRFIRHFLISLFVIPLSRMAGANTKPSEIVS